MSTSTTTIGEWQSVDPLGEALHSLHMNSVFYTRSVFTAPWGLSMPPLPNCVMFHVVTAGRCWIRVNHLSSEAKPLEPGDFVLVPHGHGHELLSTPDAYAANLFDLHREHVSERYEILHHGNGGAPTNMVCGAVRMDHPAAKHLLDQLPAEIIIKPWASPQTEWMHSTLRLMASETATLRPGGEAVITRLADILVIQAIRHWLSENETAGSGWLSALKDEQIGLALQSIHREPANNWSVELLAERAAMSRSGFAAKFHALVGEPPMQYVRRWRMYAALNMLAEENVSLGELADRLGYQSEAAFSRAFKKVLGISPGAARKQQRLPVASDN